MQINSTNALEITVTFSTQDLHNPYCKHAQHTVRAPFQTPAPLPCRPDGLHSSGPSHGSSQSAKGSITRAAARECEEAPSGLQRLRNQGETNPNRPAGGEIKEVKWDS